MISPGKFRSSEPLGLRLPLPERLEEPDSFVQQILDQSLAKALTHRATFRFFATDTAIVLVVRAMYPWLGSIGHHAILVDLSSIEEVSTHLRSLIVPARYDRLVWFWEEETELDIRELAESLVELNSFNSEIARCFLEMRLTDAYRIPAKLSNPPIGLMDEVHRGMLMIVLLHELHKAATLLADRIHRPTGWIRLDEADSVRSGSTLTTGSLTKDVKADHHLAEIVLNLYNSSSATGSTTNPNTPSAKCLRRGEKIFRDNTLLPRSEAELTDLMSKYGKQLSANLDICMLKLQELVQRQKMNLSAFSSKHHANTIYGNIGKIPPATLLHIMIKQVYSWLAFPKQGTTDWKSVALNETKYRSGHRTSSPGSLGRPRIEAGQSAIDTLHALYRVILIRDNEAVPKQLRKITGSDGNQRCARSVRQIENMTGTEFDFDRVFNLMKDSMDAGRLVDSQAKRDAKQIVSKNADLTLESFKAVNFATDTLSVYL